MMCRAISKVTRAAQQAVTINVRGKQTRSAVIVPKQRPDKAMQYSFSQTRITNPNQTRITKKNQTRMTNPNQTRKTNPNHTPNSPQHIIPPSPLLPPPAPLRCPLQPPAHQSQSPHSRRHNLASWPPCSPTSCCP